METRKLRTRKPINYSENEELPNDAYEFCDECGETRFDYCSIHGGLLVVPDSKVVNCPSDVPRAVLTAPPAFLYIDSSSIPGAGNGVFAKCTLPRGVRFGPYRGKRLKNAATNYCWQLYDGAGRASHVVDASDAERSNWMRYVNCARHSSEQNLVAYQYRGEIYYRTVKIIRPNTELLVFYGTEFAVQLNIHLGKYNSKNVVKLMYPNQSTTNATEKPEAPTISLAEALKSSSVEIRRVNGYVLGIINLDRYFNNNTFRSLDQDSATFEKILDCFDIAEDTKQKVDDKQTATEPKLDANVCAEPKIGVTDNTDQEPNVGTESNDQEPYVGGTENNEQEPDVVGTENSEQEPDVVDDDDAENDDLIDVETLNEDLTEATQIIETNIVQKKPIWKCNECGKVLSSRDRLRNHKRIHGGTQKFNCKICSYKTDVKYYYKRHEKIHNKPKRAKIPEPETKFQKVEAANKTWQCDECQNVFRSRAYLRSHKRMHGGQHKFNCTICGYITDVKYYFERHMRSAHQTERSALKCDNCGFSSHSRNVFKVHVGLHSNKNAMRCDMCDYLCTTKKYLHAHILRVHVPTRQHQCAFCETAFNCKEYLRRHLRNVHFRRDN